MVLLAVWSAPAHAHRVAVVASRVAGLQTATATAEPVIASREFEVNVPEADLAELRRHVPAT
jgi:hypothetical protein